MGLLTRPIFKLKHWLSRKRNKYPAYTITDSGIRMEYINPENIEDMPFDMSTYGNCQIFFKDYGNPISIDTQDIEESVDSDDVIFSQKYKTYMNQSVLNQVFRGPGLDTEKLRYAIYGALGIGVLNAALIMVLLAQ